MDRFEVKEAYKRLVLKHHPDKKARLWKLCFDQVAKASKSIAFQLIHEAYEYLSDFEKLVLGCFWMF